MLILGIETSTREGGVALLENGQVRPTRSLSERSERHARSLIREVQQLLRQYGYTPADVDLLSVSIGPGSFTGLRVGVVFAKTWCYALGHPLVAVDTLQVVAENAPPEIRRVHAVVDAQRGEVYCRPFVRNMAGILEPENEVRTVPVTVLAEELCADDYLTGPALIRYADFFGTLCRVAPPEDCLPRPETVARLGMRLYESGERADFWTLEPLYLRKSAAEEKAAQKEA